jgi:Zn-dependent M28 family amino/carboxypeptidase
MIRKSTLLFLFASLLTFGCKGQATQTSSKQAIKNYTFNTDSLLHHIKTLSSDTFEGRRTGTEGAKKAKDYIINQYKILGVLPVKGAYEQDFNFSGRDKTYNATNVLGLIKGTDKTEDYIVISAHYDHEGIKRDQIYNGADDDASGISALFAFAEYFKNNPPKHSIILAAFDAEELGLKGAYHFVESNIIPNKNIKLNLNMDMVSRSDNNELFAVGTRYNTQFIPVVDRFKDLGYLKLTRGHDGKDGKEDWTFSSDHAPFHKAKIPFIYFGVPDHEDYHKPTDDFKNIHPEFYKDAVQTIITVFKALDTMSL